MSQEPGGDSPLVVHPDLQRALEWLADAERDRNHGWKTRLCARVLRTALGEADGPADEKARVMALAEKVLAVADGGPADGLGEARLDTAGHYVMASSAARLAIHHLACHLLHEPVWHGLQHWQHSVRFAQLTTSHDGFDWLHRLAAEEP